jgi:predicted ABC-type transport system involved in lysophospholipase L1 biosynthesis ATPase subunit
MVSVDRPNVGDSDDETLTQLRLRTIEFVFQRFHLIMGQTAVENVAVPLEATGWGASARYARAAALLELVGLANRRLSTPPQL